MGRKSPESNRRCRLCAERSGEPVARFSFIPVALLREGDSREPSPDEQRHTRNQAYPSVPCLNASKAERREDFTRTLRARGGRIRIHASEVAFRGRDLPTECFPAD